MLWTFTNYNIFMYKDFKTVQKIGEGSFGTVFLVEDTNGKKYALKVIDINQFTKEESREEIQALKLIQHENFIKIYDYNESESSLKILTEFCDGQTLQKFCCKNCGKLSTQQICQLVDQIVNAAIYMNEKGVIHRDLKPQNILLTLKQGSPKIKICDFGSAKRSSIMREISNQIESSFQKGTAIYTSPQQLQNQSYTSKCDVWSMGCLIYELVFSYHPYLSHSYEEMKEKMKNISEMMDEKFPKNFDPYLKIVLQISLKHEEAQRASWKQIQLFKHFIECSKNQGVFMGYLNEIGLIGEWILLEIWEEKNQLSASKGLKKILIYFISGFLYSLCQMLYGIVDKSPEFEYLGSLPNLDPKQKLLENFPNKISTFEAIYSKIKQKLRADGKLKNALLKVPNKRNPAFAHLAYTIKYSKKIIQQIITSKEGKEIVQNSKLIEIMTKWANFQKYFPINNYLKVNDIKKDPKSKTSIQWVKQELNIN